jgi:hypothetical protein
MEVNLPGQGPRRLDLDDGVGQGGVLAIRPIPSTNALSILSMSIGERRR